jgi:hypothetical protein
MATENDALNRVRRAYERGRVLRSLGNAAPLLALGALALLLDRRPAVVLGIDGLLVVTGVVLHWRGQQAGRGATLGLAAGAIPLALGLCMQGYRQLCDSSTLMPSCMVVCAVGGLSAGLWIAWAAYRRSAATIFVASAGTMALLMGSLGCSCAGTWGLFGLLGGLVVPVAAGRLHVASQAT